MLLSIGGSLETWYRESLETSLNVILQDPMTAKANWTLVSPADSHYTHSEGRV